jgi:hypothetical protein
VSARAWRASTSSCASRRGSRAQRAQHDAGIHGDERLGAAVRGVRLGYAEALDKLIELALERHERRSKLVY